MEQVLGDFFLELEATCNNFGGLALFPYLIGLITNLVEKNEYTKIRGVLDISISKNVAEINETELDLIGAEAVNASYFKPGRVLTPVDLIQKEQVVQECDRIAAKLQKFQETRNDLMNLNGDIEQKHNIRKSLIAKYTFCSTGLILLGFGVKAMIKIIAGRILE